MGFLYSKQLLRIKDTNPTDTSLGISLRVHTHNPQGLRCTATELSGFECLLQDTVTERRALRFAATPQPDHPSSRETGRPGSPPASPVTARLVRPTNRYCVREQIRLPQLSIPRSGSARAWSGSFRSRNHPTTPCHAGTTLRTCSLFDLVLFSISPLLLAV